MQLDDKAIARYWAKVNKAAGLTGCWYYSSTPQGQYGSFSIGYEYYPATHVALTLVGKPRPSDSHIACHTCDDTRCVQPLHLYWGTDVQNAKDRSHRGRWKNQYSKR